MIIIIIIITIIIITAKVDNNYNNNNNNNCKSRLLSKQNISQFCYHPIKVWLHFSRLHFPRQFECSELTAEFHCQNWCFVSLVNVGL